ncbi:MAG: hypothetical protein JETT_1378 [Candidatus Jettenia ecosi]|uniref:Transmembrane protein n=1 Tax=Candidatus Jettenia ecosi TaxID=2494326 RepID=A0A533QC84_9BACT|nr:MAG: hypothetical protein JETT_1378 [Candidatus Jettenia ecosi]
MKIEKVFFNLVLLIFTDLLKQYKQESVDIVKIKALMYYIKSVKIARFAYLGLFLLLVLFICMVNGFLLIHVAFFYYMPWSRDVKLLTVFVLGICYFFIPMGIYMYYASQRSWMKLSKANELMHKVLDKDV